MSFLKHAGRDDNCVECGDSPCAGAACCMYRSRDDGAISLSYEHADAPDSILVDPVVVGGVYTAGEIFLKVNTNYAIVPLDDTEVNYSPDGFLYFAYVLGIPVAVLPKYVTSGVSGQIWTYVFGTEGDEHHVTNTEGKCFSATPTSGALTGVYTNEPEIPITIVDTFSSAYSVDFGSGVTATVSRTSVVPQSCTWQGTTTAGSVVTLKWAYGPAQTDRKMWHVTGAFVGADVMALGVSSYAGDKDLSGGAFNNVPTGAYETHTITPTVS